MKNKSTLQKRDTQTKYPHQGKKRGILKGASTFLFACVSLTPIAANADVGILDRGNYTMVQTAANIFKPQEANNPVDDDLRDEMPFMSFIENTADDDGFKPRKYGKWQTIDLKADEDEHGDGAVKCMNGDDYKFLVQRSASSSNMVIFFEGGGGCWDYDTCQVTDGGQSNSGLIGSYMLEDKPDIALRAGSQSSLFTSNLLRKGYHPKYERWTKVYLPYCTQDLHLGNQVNEYKKKVEQEDGTVVTQSLTANQRGITIQGAVLTWLKANLEQPVELLMTGQSAGGFASEILYHTYRTALKPEKGYLINDAGPIMIAGDEGYHPSNLLHQKVMEEWSAESLAEWMEEESEMLTEAKKFNSENMGTISNFLSARWPDDRFSLLTARKDHVISGFSYNTTFDTISQQGSVEERDEMRWEMRKKEMQTKKEQLDKLENYGYLIPGYRPAAGGHVLSIPWIEESTTNETDGNNVYDLIHNVLSENGSVMQSWESDDDLDWDINGRYDDCINEQQHHSGQALTIGDVYLQITDEDGDQPDTIIEWINIDHIGSFDHDAFLAKFECLQPDPDVGPLEWFFSGIGGIEKLEDLAPSEDMLKADIRDIFVVFGIFEELDGDPAITNDEIKTAILHNVLDAGRILAKVSIHVATTVSDAIGEIFSEAEAIKAKADAAKADAAAAAAKAKAAADAAIADAKAKAIAAANKAKAAADAAAAKAKAAKAKADAAAATAKAKADAAAKKLCGRWCRG